MFVYNIYLHIDSLWKRFYFMERAFCVWLLRSHPSSHMLICASCTFLSFFSNIRSLPGVSVLVDCVKNAIPVILFYSFFLYHILTYVLRIALNYYHFSINEFHHIPHIVSFIGPLVCQYPAWLLSFFLLTIRVVGVYCVIVLVILPFNRDGIWMSFFLI